MNIQAEEELWAHEYMCYRLLQDGFKLVVSCAEEGDVLHDEDYLVDHEGTPESCALALEKVIDACDSTGYVLIGVYTATLYDMDKHRHGSYVIIMMNEPHESVSDFYYSTEDDYRLLDRYANEAWDKAEAHNLNLVTQIQEQLGLKIEEDGA